MKLADEIRALMWADSPWQPIETAPKDGTTFLAVVDTVITSCKWSVPWDSFLLCTNGTIIPIKLITHWMPLPQPPEIEG